jgi:uncharacterized SAM-binding protein YcdF (DUF218 family)
VTQLVEFAFSVGGILCAVTAALIWVRLRDRSVLARRLLILIIAGYLLASTFPVSYHVGRLLSARFHPLATRDVPTGRIALVLLGAGTFSARDWNDDGVARPNRTGADRVVEAVRVYRLIHPEFVISSGGRAFDSDAEPPSGESMRDMLVELGVPASQILTETTSRTTHEEAVIVRSMLQSRPVDHIVLVTSDLHMRRSLGAFRAQGIEAIPAIARRPHDRIPWELDFLPSDSGLGEAREVAREVLGIGYYTARGWYRF